MSYPETYVHDDKSLCPACNAYVVGEHQPFCNTLKRPSEPMSDERLARVRELLVRMAKVDPASGSCVSREFSVLSRADAEALIARLDLIEQPPMHVHCSCPAPDLKVRPTFYCRNCQNVFVP